MRKVISIITILLSSIVLSGCWDRIEVNDLAIVLATGIDYEDERYQLTSQIFIPRKAGGGSSGGSEASPSGVTMIRTAEGRTVAEALNRLQRKVPRNMFWGHCEVIVISEHAGKQGLRQYIDFLLRYPQFREHAYVFSTSDSAKDILALLDPLERSSAESLREMANMKLGTRVTVLELAQSIEGPSRSATLSRMLMLPPDPGKDRYDSTPYIKGLSLYKNDHYIKTVTEPMSVGILLLANELENIIIPVQLKNMEGSFSIMPIEMHTALTPQIINNEWRMQVQVKSKGEVVLNTTDANLTDPTMLKELDRAWSEHLKELAEKALVMAQKQLKTDFFQFATEFRRHYPKQWNAQQKNWDELFSTMDVQLKVEALVTRTGKSVGPQGIPEQGTD
ncbi:spore germination protein KC [Paenibacillus amylolyticus]|uniref:Spore germination protein KC n=1 Tax=Paenibacillus amylolyticus TaxID=1451 RepID=A0AAP5LR35_PAEAM|nr:Ger(x)C family spore germination protein [Paenibacillus amylolyticus]MDR6726290.1 spore germination protein KC [Paenibacillus amylolyticus]